MNIAISGAAGQISYSLIFQLISGDLLGFEQPINLSLLEVPEMIGALSGVAMELKDCASPVLNNVTCHSNPEVAFKDADLIFLIGARPRGPGMERKDLLQTNAGIFSVQGRAINAVAKRSVKVLIVGNPANTNSLIARTNAPDLPSESFIAMSRLDHNRAVSLAASQCGCNVSDVARVIVWGNHSATQYPDLYHATVGGESVLERVGEHWFKQEFIGTVQNRGTEVIKTRGKSSAGSAAHAALEQMRDWVKGTQKGDWKSMIVASDGSYGVEQGLMYSFPVQVSERGIWSIVQGLEINEFSAIKIKESELELMSEREAVSHLIPSFS